MVSVPFSFELSLIAHKTYEGLDSTYKLNSNHIKAREYGEHEFPSLNCDWRYDLWDKLPEEAREDYNLEHRILDRAWDDFNECYGSDEFENENGFKLTFCLNMYNIIALIPFEETFDKREELEDDLEYVETDPFEKKEILEEIESVDEELIECTKSYMKFETLKDYLKNWFEDYICVYKYEDGNKVFDFVHYTEYDDFLKSEGWKSWDEYEEIKEEINEKTTLEVKSCLVEQLKELVPNINKQTIEVVCNTVLA